MELKDKTFLVTGGTSGVGKAIATGIATTGANVVIVSRNASNGQQTVKEISAKSANKNISFLTADLSLMESVVQLSEQFKQQHHQLHGLVNAAGAWYFKKEITSEGIDKSFAINYLCHYTLTNSLLDLLKATDDARIVTVAGAPRFLNNPKIDLNDLQHTKYSWMKAIRSEMFARVYFGFELSDRLQNTSASSMLFHPGFVKSNLGKNTAPWWLKLMFSFSPDVRNAPETCDSGVYVATKENAKSTNGKFFDEKNNIVDIRKNFDPSTGKELWLLSEQLSFKK
ncbi:SDR family NAD(P)-dependent oxidoreductase [Microbacter margulisiae]|uniref:NAD(P)-dependent dehydrogenase (Short-subunit alcohol dehydrogenase family) n=1 Tax=Microbacter margulisiae TaxID=1350067 RepID=A0A7W5H147_9PORP|nr:SDR family NAD(P)-dependent oxidoreductase [Microbacter margulisiae]MBB3186335.1 NAD(P)-dependent dehydrogenase (short-subunit alcohol dehydrogenase family) [Microbacter margulisiae]